MEQILSFVLGVVIVALPLAVIGMFKTRKEVNKLAFKHRCLEDAVNELNRSHYADVSQLNSTIVNEVNELIRKIDSKGDRSEARHDARINQIETFADLSQHATEKLQYQLAELQVALENYINKEK